MYNKKFIFNRKWFLIKKDDVRVGQLIGYWTGCYVAVKEL
jgi:hypothetical protein